MAEETKTEVAENLSTAVDMVVENSNNGDAAVDAVAKRPREEATCNDQNEDGSKKQKVNENDEDSEAVTVTLGPKSFGSAVEMFDYFVKLLHYWPHNLDVNEYESMILLDLIKKGHPEPEKKIGGGIHTFQVRNHPMFKSKCYFLIREDGIADDFSFRKCVNHILPLPEDMRGKSDVDRAFGGGKGRGGRGGHGRGRGRGGRGRY